jgi:hypothetical protein
MTNVLSIARREIEERSFVFVAAAAFAILPLLVALLPLAGRAAEKISLGGGILSVGFTLGLGVALGTSILGRDLSSGKLSFYFARPLSVASLWAGKLIAAAVLMGGAFAIAYLPVLFVLPTWRATWNVDLGSFLGVIAIVATTLFLLSHAISTAVRSRSWLIAVDLVMLIVVAVAVAWVSNPLLEGFALKTTGTIWSIMLATFIAAIVPAGLVQLSRGRTDRFRSHAAMSTFIWSVAVALVLVALIAVQWIVSAKPSDLESIMDYGRSKDGSRVFFTGNAGKLRGDYLPSFIGEVKSGHYVPAPRALRYTGGAFSEDGSHAAYLEPSNFAWVAAKSLGSPTGDPGRFAFELVVSNLADPPQRRVIASSGFNDGLAMSKDGSRVAMLATDGTLSVFDSNSGALKASAKMQRQGRDYVRLHFASNDLVRVYTTHRAVTDGFGDVTISIHELSVADRRFRQSGSIATWGRFSGVVPSSDGRTVLVRTTRQGQDALAHPAPAGAPPMVQLVDASTGTMHFGVSPSLPDAKPSSAWLLEDGRIALIESRGDQLVLRMFAADGRPAGELPLGTGEVARIEFEVPDGVIVVGMTARMESLGRGFIAQWRTLSIDTKKLALLHASDHLRPVPDAWMGIGAGASPHTTVACLDADKRIVRWDALTGKGEPVVWQN